MIKFLFTMLLNVIGVLILAAVIVVPSLPQFRNDKRVDSLLGNVLCQSNERLVREPSNNPALRTIGLSITPYCIGRNGQRNDVTIRWLVIGLGGFGFAMLFGVVLDIMLLLNGFRHGVRQLSIWRNRPVTFSTTPSQPPSENLELSLSERLIRLEDARKSGLITREQYDQLRKDILDKMQLG